MVAKQILLLLSAFLKTEGKIIWKTDLKVSFKLIQVFGISLSPQNPLGVVWLSLTGN